MEPKKSAKADLKQEDVFIQRLGFVVVNHPDALT